MQISEFMTSRPTTVGPHDSLDEVQRTMDEAGFRHLPVVEGGRLVGVLSDRDLFSATGGLPARVHACRGPAGAEGLPREVAQVMRRDVVTAAPDETLAPVLLKLLQWRVGCLPVVDGTELVGIVTERDFLDAYREITSQEDVGEPVGPPVECFMSEDPVTVGVGDSIETAIERCASERIRHLPVVDPTGRLGVVSDRDLRRGLGTGRSLEDPVDRVTTWEAARIAPQAELRTAAARMADGSISSLLVVDGGQLVGIVTATDVLERLLDAAWMRVPPA